MKHLLVTSVLCLILLTPSHASTTSVITTTKNDVTPSASPPPTSMPPGWEGMCHVTNLTAGSRVILCHVTSASRWDIDTFRNWSRMLGAGHVIDLDVTCSSGGAILLPWPYRAHNLRSLTVRHCKLLDWLKESSRPHFLKLIKDKLQYLRLENNVAMIRLKTLNEVMRNTNEEFDCGPRNLKSYVQSGTDFEFDPSESLTENETLVLMGDYLQSQSNSTKNITCWYNSLEAYEDTHRSFNSIFSVYLLSKNAKLPKLSHVNLSHGQRVDVPMSFGVWHQEFPALRTLNLSHNLIQNFNLGVFGYMMEGVLDLTYNNVTTLSKPELTSLRVLESVLLNVSHNPFHCACATADFSDFLHHHAGPEEAQLDPRYSYLWGLTCQSPLGRRGRRVSEFSREDLCSHGDKRVFLLLLLLPLAAMLVGLYYRFRLEVDVFLFARLGWLRRCGRGKGRGLERQPEYDVYVSHGQGERDVQFVLRELLPRLEASQDRPRGERRQGLGCYKLCLECRDFQVGAHVAENILTKMAGSRAVVMLLSADMPADSWAEFEFQEALFRAVSERRRLLVFLQRGSLEPRRLSPALRRALRLFPLLQIGERQFWNKLEYFLKANAAFPVNVRRSGCPCRRSKLDAEKELKEVSRLAHANFRRNRQSIRMNAPTSSEFPATAAEERTREATPCCEVSTHDSVTSLSSEDASRGDDEDTSVVCISESQNGSEGAATSVVRDGDSVNVSEEGDTASDKELPSYSECVDEQSPLPTSSSESDSSGSDLQKLQSDLTSAGARHSLGNDSDVTAKSRFETVAATPEICVTVV